MNKNEKFVITINREVGTGGRTVGRKLAEKLGVKYCDKAIVEGLTHKFGLTIERIEEIKAQKKSWWNDINNYYNTLVNSTHQPMEAEVKLDNQSLFETEKRILEEVAEQSSCVVAGRTVRTSVSKRLVKSSRRWIPVARLTSRNMRIPRVTIPATMISSFRRTN